MKVLLLVALVVVLAPEMTSSWRVRSFVSRAARAIGNVLRKKEIPVERDLSVRDVDVNDIDAADLERMMSVREVLDLLKEDDVENDDMF